MNTITDSEEPRMSSSTVSDSSALLLLSNTSDSTSITFDEALN